MKYTHQRKGDAAARQDWWTPKRRAKWRNLDKAIENVIESYTPERSLLGGLSLHASAPNPHGINAEDTPDKWYASLPYGVDHHVDVQDIKELLEDEVGTLVTVESRPTNWEDGYWLVIQNANVLEPDRPPQRR